MLEKEKSLSLDFFKAKTTPQKTFDYFKLFSMVVLAAPGIILFFSSYHQHSSHKETMQIIEATIASKTQLNYEKIAIFSTQVQKNEINIHEINLKIDNKIKQIEEQIAIQIAIQESEKSNILNEEASASLIRNIDTIILKMFDQKQTLLGVKNFVNSAVLFKPNEINENTIFSVSEEYKSEYLVDKEHKRRIDNFYINTFFELIL